MTDELKPVNCGCGGESKVQRVRTLKAHVFVVMCKKCQIATDYYTTETEAIEAWNLAMRCDKYEHHIDHTDCIWYWDGKNRCPSTCSQYRDGWNDAMNYIFKNGKGYNPYRRGEHE